MLEDFAAAARFYGLKWTSGRVGDFESGRVSPTLPTLIAVTAALSDLLGRKVAVGELLAGEGRVSVNDRLSLDLETVRDVLHDGFEVRLADISDELDKLKKSHAEFLERRKHWPKSLDVPAKLHHNVYQAMRDSDIRMCKNIGVDRDLGAAAMAKLWRKTFTARRDEEAGPNANPQERGQVSRRLKAELENIIQRKGK